MAAAIHCFAYYTASTASAHYIPKDGNVYVNERNVAMTNRICTNVILYGKLQLSSAMVKLLLRNVTTR